MRGRMIRLLVPVAVVAALGAGAALAATAALRSGTPSVKTVNSPKFGLVLVSSGGRTLYRYTVDTKGVNRCSGVTVCAKYWPALLVRPGVNPSAGAGVKASLLGTIKAANGMRQVTYAGFPLYTFAGDTKAGQTSGQGFDKQWYVVSTKGTLVKAAVGSGASTGSKPAPPSSDPGYGTTTTGGAAWG
jgi:predicted lipoprotein with Yx(FWY)xxD motif